MQSTTHFSHQEGRLLSSRRQNSAARGPESNEPFQRAERETDLLGRPSTPAEWLVSQLSPGQSAPADFMADPDGNWQYEQLLAAAGYDPSWGQVQIGALTEDFQGFVEGSAVVALQIGNRCSVALIDCVCALSRGTGLPSRA